MKWGNILLNKLSFIITVLIFFSIFIVGCSNSLNYKDEDVAAMVRGEEITVGDLRLLYTDDKVMSNLEGTVKAMLIMQEAKDMNMDVTEEIEQAIRPYPLEDTGDKLANSIQEFAKSQGKKLGMGPEEYYMKYQEVTAEMGAYVNAYVMEMLGETDMEDLEQFDERANQLIDDLMEKYKDEIEIYIK